MSRVSVLIFGVLLAIVYIVYTASYNWLEALLGFAVGLFAAYMFLSDMVTDVSKLSLRRALWAIYYLLKYFTVVELKAHLGLVKIVLSRRPVYRPAIVKVPFNYSSKYTVVAVANSITNTPGTVVVDVDEDEKAYFVHWINAVAESREEARKAIVGDFEKELVNVFE